ncbi:threonylcarbamoyl-AMP synthase [Candidatus Saccharibacteria bacterium]|nr:threonylcarbamoyl-AMP synthase [Candidatus Saccharibacteria bacterium]
MKSIARTDWKAAKTTLASGGILAVPTETVYGLAVRYDDDIAIKKLMGLKDRAINSGKVLTMMVANVSEIPNFAIVTREQMSFARRYFPGELTLILKKNPDFKNPYFDNFDTIGIRIPAHGYMLSLLKKTGPLLVTSANLRGEAPCKSADEAKERLPMLDGIVTGKAGGSLPSTIIDWSESIPRQIRTGGLLIVHY